MKVGDKLYGYDLQEFVVSKIGRQYAYLEGSKGYKVDLGTMKVPTYNGSFQLYKSMQEVNDEKEHSLLLAKIRQFFSMWSGNPVTLQQLRDVAGILKI